MKKVCTIIITIIIATSCKKVTTKTNENSPFSKPDYGKLKETVVVFNSNTAKNIISIDSNSITLKTLEGLRTTNPLQSPLFKVVSGTVLVSPPIQGVSDYGFARKVVSIDYGAGSIVSINTTPALLLDIWEELVLSDKARNLDANTDVVVDFNGRPVNFGTISNGIKLNIENEIEYESPRIAGKITAKLATDISLRNDLLFGIIIKENRIKYLKYGIKSTSEVSSKLELDASLSGDSLWRQTPFYTQKFKPILFTIPLISIPVSITPEVDLEPFIKLDGGIKYEGDLFKYSKVTERKMIYDEFNGDPKTNYWRNEESTEKDLPNLKHNFSINGEFKAGITTKLKGKFYDLKDVAVEIGASMYIKISGETVVTSTPITVKGSLKAGIDVYAKAYVNVFNYKLLECKAEAKVFEWQLSNFTVPIYSPPTISNNGLISYYPFNNNANDESGNSNNGTLMNTPTFTTGISGQSIKLTGRCNYGWCEGSMGDHVLLPMPQFNSMSAFSLNIWVKEESLLHPDGEAYISFGTDQGGSISIGHFANEIRFVSSTNSVIAIPFNAGNINTFQMYTLVFDSGTLRAYQNGVLVGTKMNAVRSVSGTVAAIARHWGLDTYTRFNGNIDQVRIYDRGLTDNEIGLLYTSKL